MSIKNQIFEIVRTHKLIKARQIVSILNNDYNMSITKTQVNSELYKMKTSGSATINSNYQWATTNSQVSKPKKTQSTKSPVATPAFTFTEDQQRIINLDTQGNLLIRGQAGSGKTTVLAARAGRILSGVSKGSMLFLTYNAALCAYVRKSFKTANINNQVHVLTFHEWTKRFASKMGYEFGNWANTKTKTDLIKYVLSSTQESAPPHRLYSIKDDSRLLPWWLEEISWIYGQGIVQQDMYVKAERTGRGTAIRLSNVDRKIVWDIFEKYNAELVDEGLEDYDNAGGVIIRQLEQKNIPDSLRYDHIFIDEVQDFHQSWLMALSPIARTSLSMAGDLAQKIYKRNFTWKSAGIEVHGGRSKRLGGSFRTTKQIMEVALSLTDNTDIHNAEDYIAPTLPHKTGPKVLRICRNTPKEAYSEGCKHIKSHFSRLRAKSVAVALPMNRQAYGVKKHLSQLGIQCSVAKGGTLGSFSGGITITTFHQLKGLEFDHIVLMGLNDGNFPGIFTEHIGEEDIIDELCSLRRLIYVAMTRAKSSLTLVGSNPFCHFFKESPTTLFDDI
ncbi:MAG: 3'-5' exonuclease [Desulfovibrio sp.]